MFKKTVLILTLMLVGLLVVASVSAVDNLTDESISVKDNEVIDEIEYQENNSLNNNNENCEHNVLSSVSEDKLEDSNLIATHFEIPNTFSNSIKINLKDSSDNVIKNAQIRYSFDYSNVQTTYSGNSVTIPSNLESQASHALLLNYFTDGTYANCIQKFYFYKKSNTQYYVTDSGPSNTMFRVSTEDGTVYGSISVTLLADSTKTINETFNYYFDNNIDNLFNATSGKIVLNLTHNTYHNITFVYNGKSSVYVPCTRTESIYYKSSFDYDENRGYYVDGGWNVQMYVLSDKSTWSLVNKFVPFGTSTISLKNTFTGEILNREITVYKRKFESNNLVTDYEDTIVYKVRAANANDEFTSDLKVTFILDGKGYEEKTDSEGYATLKIHLKAGNYTITTKYCGIVNKNTITINPIYLGNNYTNMFINSANIYYGESKNINYGWQGNFKGQLLIYKGSSIVKNIDLDNSKWVDDYYTADSFSNSFSTLILDSVGDYTLKIINSKGSIVAQSSIKIKKIPTQVESYYYEIFKNYKDSVNIYLEEKNTKKPMDGIVTVKINGKSYTVNVKNGVGELTFTSPSKIKKYKCTMYYAGDSKHESSSNTFILNVVKADCDILVSDITKAKPKSKITVKAKIYYYYGTKKVKSGTLKFKINGKTYKAKIKNGIAKLKIKAPSKGKIYNCKATYGGNKNIKASYAKFKITVKSKNKKTATKKSTKFTVVVPAKLNMKITKSHGKYKVQTYKWIDYDSNGRHAHLRLSIFKNGKHLTNYKAEYYLHYSSGGGIWSYTNNHGETGYKSRYIGFNNVLKIDKITATIWP